MQFILSEQDAAALGIPREVTYDEERLGLKDAIALEEQAGMSVDTLGTLLSGKPVTENGGPVWETDDRGKLVVDEQGNPVQKRDVSTRALAIALWLGCRQAGSKVDFDDFDVNLLAMNFVEADQGKGGNRAEKRAKKKTPSAGSSKRTKPRSRTSSTSGPGSTTS